MITSTAPTSMVIPIVPGSWNNAQVQVYQALTVLADRADHDRGHNRQGAVHGYRVTEIADLSRQSLTTTRRALRALSDRGAIWVGRYPGRINFYSLDWYGAFGDETDCLACASQPYSG